MDVTLSVDHGSTLGRILLFRLMTSTVLSFLPMTQEPS